MADNGRKLLYYCTKQPLTPAADLVNNARTIAFPTYLIALKNVDLPSQ